MTEADLIGRWRSDASDPVTQASIGDSIQEFFPGGLLMYATRQNGQMAVMELTYRLENNWLITDQPSAPHEQRMLVSIDSDGRLLLGPSEERTIFLRAAGVSFVSSRQAP